MSPWRPENAQQLWTFNCHWPNIKNFDQSWGYQNDMLLLWYRHLQSWQATWLSSHPTRNSRVPVPKMEPGSKRATLKSPRASLWLCHEPCSSHVQFKCGNKKDRRTPHVKRKDRSHVLHKVKLIFIVLVNLWYTLCTENDVKLRIIWVYVQHRCWYIQATLRAAAPLGGSGYFACHTIISHGPNGDSARSRSCTRVSVYCVCHELSCVWWVVWDEAAADGRGRARRPGMQPTKLEHHTVMWGKVLRPSQKKPFSVRNTVAPSFQRAFGKQTVDWNRKVNRLRGSRQSADGAVGDALNFASWVGSISAQIVISGERVKGGCKGSWLEYHEKFQN